ncbi:uncharacterized protein LODBEIA_P01440 [Lodderomyces beijingensis]|uniref:Shugoshin C-terminal domain-containing protein n=1 Tax=Lodderomyces beijingensis TaxID=1775926 RepID=A0ABP0ZCL2_9ASCO
MPFSHQLDGVASAGKFQYVAMIDRINHLKMANANLAEKVKRQKEFLYAAKEEITHLSKYKAQVEHFKSEVADLKQQLQERERSPTFDLSHAQAQLQIINGSTKQDQQFLQPKKMQTPTHQHNFASSTFITNVQQQSLGKSLPRVASAICSKNRDAEPKRFSFFAESSTKIGELNDNRSAVLSRGPTSTIASSRSNFQKVNFNRLGKTATTTATSTRSGTSQLASRLTANTKVGMASNHKKLKTFAKSTNSKSNMIDKGPVSNKILPQKYSDTSSNYFHR